MMVMSSVQVLYLKVDIFDVKRGYKRVLFFRCICGAIGMPCFFMSVKYIPSSKANLIFNVHPLLVSVVAYYLLKEQITRLKVLAVVGSFLGVLLFSLHKNDSEAMAGDHYYLGIVLVAFACIAGMIIVICLRIMNQHIHYILGPFYSAVTGCIQALSILILMPSLYHLSTMNSFEFWCLVLSGMSNYFGQLFASLAVKYEEASVVTPFKYSETFYLFL